MTDTIRDLLISLSSHMAYMQGQLEARHELDDFEDFYWYRESILLRQKVTDALADGPAVPEGREPASVTGQPKPVPVSERLPGPEDCDKWGRCWIYMPDIGTAPSWRLVDPREINPYHTHWLPAHALPLPEAK